MNIRQTIIAILICAAILLTVWGIATTLHYFDIYNNGAISSIWLLTYVVVFALYILVPLLLFQLLRLALRKNHDNKQKRDERIE